MLITCNRRDCTNLNIWQRCFGGLRFIWFRRSSLLGLLSTHLKTSKTRSISFCGKTTSNSVKALIYCLLSINILRNFETSKSTWWGLLSRLLSSKRFVRSKSWWLLWSLFFHLIKISFINIISWRNSCRFLHFLLIISILYWLIHEMQKGLFQSWI